MNDGSASELAWFMTDSDPPSGGVLTRKTVRMVTSTASLQFSMQGSARQAEYSSSGRSSMTKPLALYISKSAKFS